MHAARCPSPTGRGGGTPAAQAGSTNGQRVRNTQPEGGSAGDGGSPARMIRATRRAGSSVGEADSKARV